MALPGKARKSTTVAYANDLLDEVPNVNIASSAMTQQALMKRLADTGDCSVSISSSEFGSFIAPSKMMMIDFLTDLFDGKKKHTSDTLIRGIEYAENPCVNLVAATTPSWISNNLSETMIGGGFISRVISIYEHKARQRKIFYDDVDMEAMNHIRSNLVEDLKHLAVNAAGEFNPDDEARAFIKEWYEDTADKNGQDDYRLSGYFERKPAHALKLSMLLHLSYSDELIITVEDFKAALTILGQVENNMTQVFQTVGKNEYASEMDTLYEYIQTKGKVSRRELLGRFYHIAEPVKLMELITALVQMEKITTNGSDPKEICYHAIQAK